MLRGGGKGATAYKCATLSDFTHLVTPLHQHKWSYSGLVAGDPLLASSRKHFQTVASIPKW